MDKPLTADDLYRTIMEIWERRAREELGDHNQSAERKLIAGDRRGEQAA